MKSYSERETETSKPERNPGHFSHFKSRTNAFQKHICDLCY